MQAQADSPQGDPDLLQVDRLCDDVQVRAEVVRKEQAALGELVSIHEQRRSYRAEHYRALLEGARMRYHRLCAVIARYCR